MATRHPSMEHCALKLLSTWEWTESEFHNDFTVDASGDVVRRALSYFKVNRGFPGIAEVDAKTQSSIAKMLSEQEGKDEPEDIIAHVEEFACSLGELTQKERKATGEKKAVKYKEKPISAASKLLWLRFRGKYVIYDSNVRAALKKETGKEKMTRGYQAYYEDWQRVYECKKPNIKSQINKACKILKGTSDKLPGWHHSQEDRKSIYTEDWFQRRVLDLYLWEIGPKPKEEIAPITAGALFPE